MTYCSHAGCLSKGEYCKVPYLVCYDLETDFSTETKTKDTNGKPRLGYVYKSLMNAIAKVREYGNKKYPEGGPDNWTKVEPDEYYHALMRHVAAMCDAKFNPLTKESPIDPESGMPHSWHAAVNLMFIIEREANSLPSK